MPAALLLATLSAASAAPRTTVHSWGASVTTSALHLALPGLRPAIELTGEIKLGPRYSVSAIAGLGWGDPLYGAGGGQVTWYALGNFRGGMQLGGEIYGLGGRFSDGDWTSYYSGGPFVGGKYIADIGLTLGAQLGLALTRALRREPDIYVIQRQFAPTLNAQVGWSF